MKQITISLILVLALGLTAWSQGGRLKYAQEQYAQMAYVFAAEAYEDVLERGIDSVTVASSIADSYAKINNIEKAVSWYAFMDQNSMLSKEEHLTYALLLRQVENYSASKEQLERFAARYGANDITDNYLSSSITEEELRRKSPHFGIYEQTLHNSVSDIAPSYIDQDRILIASALRQGAAIKRVTGQVNNFFYNLYTAPIDEQGNIGKLQLLKGDVNTKYHDGPGVYDATSGFVYFTRDNYFEGKEQRDERKIMRLKIFRGVLEDQKITQIEELPFNSDAYSCGHPAISSDGKTLYFVSDMPGGYGGTDVYKTTLEANGSWSNPENLGSGINTSEDELFPFVHPDGELLFFASKGHKGLGGLDVFMAKLNKQGGIVNITNLGAPVNSPHDDFGFINNKKQNSGYFTSNRPSETDGSQQDHVYLFQQTKPFSSAPVLEGLITDLGTGNPLPEAWVIISDKQGNRLDSVQTSKRGEYSYSLDDIDHDMALLITKEGFFEEESSVSFSADAEGYNVNMGLLPNLGYFFSGMVKNQKTNEELEGVSIIILNQEDDAQLLTTSTDANGEFATEVLEILQYKGMANVKFKLKKQGYLPKTIKLSTLLEKENEIRASEMINLNLVKFEKGKTLLDDILGLEPIQFAINSDEINPQAAIQLDKVVAFLEVYPTSKISFSSHTCRLGSAAYNMELSKRRAKSSLEYILNYGIDPSRISVVGYGEERPLVPDSVVDQAPTPEEREKLLARNRRTADFIVTDY